MTKETKELRERFFYQGQYKDLKVRRDIPGKTLNQMRKMGKPVDYVFTLKNVDGSIRIS